MEFIPRFIPRKLFVCVSGSSRVPLPPFLIPVMRIHHSVAVEAFCMLALLIDISKSILPNRNYKPLCFPQMNVAAMGRMFDMLTGDYLACTPPTCKLFSFLTFPLL